MIRIILILIILILFGIYTIFSDIVFAFVKDEKIKSNYNYNVVRFILTIIAKIAGAKTHIYGGENLKKIDKDIPLFIVSNHRGYFDIVTGYLAIDRYTAIVAKDTLKNIPLLSHWMKKIDCIFLDRKSLRSGAEMVLNAIKLITEKKSIWIFPEGTRNKNDDPCDLLPFKSGVYKIPEKTDCYIVPMAIINSEKILENQFPRIRSFDIYINIGKPYKYSELSDESKKDISKYSENEMKDLIAELKEREANYGRS